MNLNNKKLITVIIPTYNRAHKIENALNSLILQTFKDFNVIIIDDGSTDNTKNIVKSYQNKLNINYIYCNNSGGPARPRNIGLYKSNTKYVAFLDSDDWWSNDKLYISLKTLQKGYSLIYHDLYINKKFFFIKNGILKSSELEKYNYQNIINSGNIIINSSVVIERDLLIKIGGYDESAKLIGSEDYDAWIRVTKISEKFVKIKSIHGYYTLSEDSISTHRNSLRNHIYLRKKYDLCSKNKNRIGPVWVMYGYSKYLFYIGKYRYSYLCAILAVKSNLSFVRKIKILCILLVSAIKMLTKY